MRRIRLLALFIGLLAIFGACAAEDPALEEPEATTATDDTADGADDIELAAAQIAVVEHEEHGEILATDQEMTLYVFLQDTEGKSTCNDTCAENWPPLHTGGDPIAGDGIDEELVGTIERDDGTTQATYNGRPLYLFASDEAAGDANGQGANDLWYVVGTDGEPMKDM